MCDLRVVMKADRSSDFGVRRWFPLHSPSWDRSFQRKIIIIIIMMPQVASCCCRNPRVLGVIDPTCDYCHCTMMLFWLLLTKHKWQANRDSHSRHFNTASRGGFNFQLHMYEAPQKLKPSKHLLRCFNFEVASGFKFHLVSDHVIKLNK